jgi:aspartyl-tRNA(Asn)/glutamyl-tRNA(Gln) amidotransferase subunit C
MKITEQDLKNISLLSKIKIDDETSSSLVQDLESILTMVNKMEELDTSKVNPLTHPIENTQTLREDEERKDIERDKLQELSKGKDSGFYITPKVIE